MIEIVEVGDDNDMRDGLDALRQAILRAPLGMEFTPEELAGQADDINLAACENGRVIGSLLLRIVDPATVEIKRMAVEDGQQGRGVGKKLMDYGEEIAWKRGYNRFVMNARIVARSFYEKLGYVASGDEFLQSTIPHVFMAKTVSRLG